MIEAIKNVDSFNNLQNKSLIEGPPNHNQLQQGNRKTPKTNFKFLLLWNIFVGFREGELN